MSMYRKADNGEINTATWARSINCDKSYRDTELSSRKEEEDEEMDEIVIEDTKQVDRAKAVRAIRWMEGRYPKELAGIRQQVLTGWLQGEQLSSGQLLTKVVTNEEQEGWVSVERDVYELNVREWQLQQAQQAQLQAHAQQLAYQQQYANQYQLQYHPDQYHPQSGYHPYQATLPSSSSAHYLPAPHSTLYLTAPGDYDGHDGHHGHAGVSGVPGVAGLLTAPPSAGEASGSKKSSSSRNKDTSRHGKTEKKRERDKEDKGRTGGKEKRQRQHQEVKLS